MITTFTDIMIKSLLHKRQLSYRKRYILKKQSILMYDKFVITPQNIAITYVFFRNE